MIAPRVKHSKCVGCRGKLITINMMNWEKWHKPVCLKHRFPEDHKWDSLKKTKPIKFPGEGDSRFHILPIKRPLPIIKPMPIIKPIVEPSPIEEVKILPVEDSKNDYVSDNKWPVWDEHFDDIQSLINHSEIHFKTVIEDHKSSCDMIKEAWPIWNRLYTINELINHWEVEHMAA